jgi:NO-binding membrane sensor protein with MHYT domain
MLRVLACITQDHDWRLVILAGVICLFASFAALSRRRPPAAAPA